ncbi:hypothetical protein PoB_005910400 [Plakobranchus ocellatus]|uniref:Secreted protein n=1 Tax=Plakobranchus ocellatus TaxID=259542 RepID=A0AAV4CII8_9GAST|nr:hypothetical protein PoB_005910400 [Plakobranchus ocellatus]
MSPSRLLFPQFLLFRCGIALGGVGFLCIASPQGDLRFLGPPSGQGADSGAGTRNTRVPADLRVHSQATVPPMPPSMWTQTFGHQLFQRAKNGPVLLARQILDELHK